MYYPITRPVAPLRPLDIAKGAARHAPIAGRCLTLLFDCCERAGRGLGGAVLMPLYSINTATVLHVSRVGGDA